MGIIYTGLRVGIYALWTTLAGWIAAHIGVTISDKQSVVIIGALTAVAVGAVASVIRWLETRPGADGWQLWARRLAAVLMLGMSTVAQPSYGQTVVATQAKIPPDEQ